MYDPLRRVGGLLHVMLPTGADMLRHQGEEGGVVVRGRIELTIGGESRVLGPGIPKSVSDLEQAARS